MLGDLRPGDALFLPGALTDRLGRKKMLLFGLVMSALSSLVMGLVNVIGLFFVATLLVGLLANTGGPAQQAMVADLLPEEKRTQGYGIIRVVVNLAVTIGPIIGGLLATQSYLLLFIFDALASLITAAVLVLLVIVGNLTADLAMAAADPRIRLDDGARQ